VVVNFHSNLQVNLSLCVDRMAGFGPSDGSSNLPHATIRLYLVSASPFLCTSGNQYSKTRTLISLSLGLAGGGSDLNLRPLTKLTVFISLGQHMVFRGICN